MDAILNDIVVLFKYCLYYLFGMLKVTILLVE